MQPPTKDGSSTKLHPTGLVEKLADGVPAGSGRRGPIVCPSACPEGAPRLEWMPQCGPGVGARNGCPKCACLECVPQARAETAQSVWSKCVPLACVYVCVCVSHVGPCSRNTPCLTLTHTQTNIGQPSSEVTFDAESDRVRADVGRICGRVRRDLGHRGWRNDISFGKHLEQPSTCANADGAGNSEADPGG